MKAPNRKTTVKKSPNFLDYCKKFVDQLFKGNFKFKGHIIPKAVVVGILGVIFLYVAVAGMVSVTAPWLVRGDTRQHIDYTWRLSHGDIPRWSDGLRYPPLVKIYGKSHEAASANPPLFYIIHASIIGPLLNQGKWEKAIAAGRAINIFMGILCIVALAWAGWLFGGKRAALFSVAVPALSVMFYRFTRLNVDYALDALLVLLATLSIINVHKLITYGLKTKYLIAAAVLSILGMATKATYIIPLGINLLAMIGAAYLHSNKKLRKQNIVKAIVSATAVLVLVGLAIGWFYYFWNYKSTGNWFSSSPKGYTGGRVPKSLLQILTSKNIWGLFYSSYSTASLSIAISSFAIAGYLSVTKQRYQQALKNKPLVFLIGLLLLTVLGVFATQVNHAVGIGAINFRYMLPAVFAFGLFLSFGLLEFKHVRGQLVALASVGMGLATLIGLGLFNRTAIYNAVLANSLPTIVPKMLIIIFALGAALLAFALYNLVSQNAVKN